jgi:hypothetical protein
LNREEVEKGLQLYCELFVTQNKNNQTIKRAEVSVLVLLSFDVLRFF